MSQYTPLDPNEGPTIWAKKSASNGHTYQIIIGTDPENPMNVVLISENEIERLNKLANQE